MKVLILYYSYSGNTRKIADMVHKAIGGEMAEIKTAAPYTGSYDEVVEQAQREINRGFQPEILPLGIHMEDYDTVILGSPVWWYTFAPAVSTALSQLSFAGKTVHPFATNAGWLGHTFQDVAKTCAGAKVKSGLNVRFDEDRLVTPAKQIEEWIRSIPAEASR